MTTIKAAAPKTICILRLSAIGDVTHMVPVINTLQARFPDTQITWIIGKLEHRLLKGLAGIEFIEFDKSAGWAGIKSLRKHLKGRKFDVLLQMQLSFRANLVARFVKANRRIGYDRTRSKELHGIAVNERIPYLHHCHVLDGFMQFAAHLGCDKPAYNWHIPVSDSDQHWAKNKLSKDRPNVIISPCSSHVLRNWSNENYAKLADYLVVNHQAKIILTGSPSSKEKATVKAIEDLCQHPVTNLAGQDTLKQLLSLMQQADLVISPDSGPLHMSGSVGTPVIGLLAASNYLRSGSYQYPELTVDAYPDACKKYLNKSVEAVKWGTKTEFEGAMELISLSAVLEKLQLADDKYSWSR